jgi:hypothetical protein
MTNYGWPASSQSAWNARSSWSLLMTKIPRLPDECVVLTMHGRRHGRADGRNCGVCDVMSGKMSFPSQPMVHNRVDHVSVVRDRLTGQVRVHKHVFDRFVLAIVVPSCWNSIREHGPDPVGGR